MCDLVNINQLLSNETDDDFLIELKCEKSYNTNDVCINLCCLQNSIPYIYTET
jgi:hypothetical protein